MVVDAVEADVIAVLGGLGDTQMLLSCCWGWSWWRWRQWWLSQYNDKNDDNDDNEDDDDDSDGDTDGDKNK